MTVCPVLLYTKRVDLNQVKFPPSHGILRISVGLPRPLDQDVRLLVCNYCERLGWVRETSRLDTLVDVLETRCDECSPLEMREKNGSVP